MISLVGFLLIYYQEQQPGGSGDASMEGLIKAGTLALQLLPRNALKGALYHTP